MYCILIREGFREEKTLKKSGLLEIYIYGYISPHVVSDILSRKLEFITVVCISQCSRNCIQQHIFYILHKEFHCYLLCLYQSYLKFWMNIVNEYKSIKSDQNSKFARFYVSKIFQSKGLLNLWERYSDVKSWEQIPPWDLKILSTTLEVLVGTVLKKKEMRSAKQDFVTQECRDK